MPKKFTVELSDEMLAEFDQLMIKCDIKKRNELFDHAMSLMKWAAEGIIQGKEIAIVDRGSMHIEILHLTVETHLRKFAQTFEDHN